MVKIQLIDGRYSVTLPKALVKAKGWEKGTELAAVFNERGNIEYMLASGVPKLGAK